MPDNRIYATYLIESPNQIEHAAEMLAAEQSTGTFIAVPGETEELKQRFRTQLESVTRLESSPAPSLPGGRVKPKFASDPPEYQRAEVTVSIPLEMTGTEITTVMASVLGNIFELAEVSGIRLIDLHLPPSFSVYPMPQFGIDGTRRLAGVEGRPMIGTIIKPSVGLTPEQTAGMVRELADAGIDFIKDDELMVNPPSSPLAERVMTVMRVINEAAERTGKKVMYAFNISSDDIETVKQNHDAVLAAGGTCVMLNINHIGMAAVMALRRHSALPIHAHRNGWGMLTRFPLLGMSYKVYQQFWRLAGVDHMHVNGINNKFWEDDDSVVNSIEACLKPLYSDSDRILPVISSGQWGGQAPETYRRTGTTDLLYLAGGGIQAHPLGAAAGVRAIQQAWEAALAGKPLEEYAREHIELAKAIELFGKRG
jgi:ribulose-bisphosphate carboxylase large chain